MRVKVNVTKNDIKKGVINDTENCPIALSFKKLLKSCYRVKIWSDKVKVNGDFGGLLPKIAQKFVKHFDDNGFADPIVFSFRIPNKYLKPSVGIKELKN